MDLLAAAHGHTWAGNLTIGATEAKGGIKIEFASKIATPIPPF
jgi:hypothetical protein